LADKPRFPEHLEDRVLVLVLDQSDYRHLDQSDYRHLDQSDYRHLDQSDYRQVGNRLQI
jgi:hypothetical protein